MCNNLWKMYKKFVYNKIFQIDAIIKCKVNVAQICKTTRLNLLLNTILTYMK